MVVTRVRYLGEGLGELGPLMFRNGRARNGRLAPGLDRYETCAQLVRLGAHLFPKKAGGGYTSARGRGYTSTVTLFLEFLPILCTFWIFFCENR